ncbi:MAG: putative polysaccharide transporter ATP-binding protein [Actinomycetia bacterium]|nr:putative polysaccharide transporter ATP-binding protein [Actinomycetes bacterium]
MATVEADSPEPPPRPRWKKDPPPLDTPLAVVVDNVSITYEIFQEARVSLRAVIARGFRGRAKRQIHAIEKMSFQVRQGESVGLVGGNGAGKSTMLAGIAGLLPVKKGAIYARTRPTLLGVAAALNPSLSGRRNIYLGGLALGLSGPEIAKRVDEIVEFSGLDDFIDLPMRAYSSGMRARLHFSIATAVAPEILLIDEALAVGDRQFKRRSFKRIEEIREHAGTIFIVSHNLNEIRRMCTRAIWIDHGEMVMDGDPEEVVDAYERRDDQRAIDDGEEIPDTDVTPATDDEASW